MADEIKQLLDMVSRLKITVEEGFKQVDRKFEQVDRRFQQIDKRFEQVDKRFEQVNKKFEQVDKRFDNVESAIAELKSNQLRILNSVKLIEQDVRSNQKHIERLEEKESFL